jgi:hypothetical protein
MLHVAKHHSTNTPIDLALWNSSCSRTPYFVYPYRLRLHILCACRKCVVLTARASLGRHSEPLCSSFECQTIRRASLVAPRFPPRLLDVHSVLPSYHLLSTGPLTPARAVRPSRPTTGTGGGQQPPKQRHRNPQPPPTALVRRRSAVWLVCCPLTVPPLLHHRTRGCS